MDIRQGVNPALLERERLLQQQVNSKETSRLQMLNDKNRETAAVEKELRTLLSEYEDVQARIRATSPRFAALTQPVALTLKEIQELLDEETLLLEYMLGEQRSFLWAITAHSICSFELPKRAEIERAARQTYRLLSTSHYRQHKRGAQLAGGELSRILLAPVAAKLGKKRLLIVADGALQYVPFGALPEPPAEGFSCEGNGRQPGKENWLPPSNPQPLILQHEIVNLPSVSVLAEIRRELYRRPSTNASVAILADPVLHKDDPRSKTGESPAGAGSSEQSTPLRPEELLDNQLILSARESGLNGFERLQFARQEADAIAALVNGRVLRALDFDANRALALSAELSQYRIVHFATHGLINSQHPELSGIVLSLVDRQGRPQEGFFRVHDIYNLKLGADLVVLSACQTALGKEIKGEGLVGPVRGFMYAGVPRIVASLWDVKDEATAELMKRFYKKMLQEGLRPAAALRAAQTSLWKEKRWEAPYYWAGFVLQGEWK